MTSKGKTPTISVNKVTPSSKGTQKDEPKKSEVRPDYPEGPAKKIPESSKNSNRSRGEVPETKKEPKKRIVVEEEDSADEDEDEFTDGSDSESDTIRELMQRRSFFLDTQLGYDEEDIVQYVPKGPTGSIPENSNVQVLRILHRSNICDSGYYVCIQTLKSKGEPVQTMWTDGFNLLPIVQHLSND